LAQILDQPCDFQVGGEEEGPPAIDARDAVHGATALHLAAHFGHDGVLAALLAELSTELSPDCLEAADADGRTALHRAVAGRSVDIIAPQPLTICRERFAAGGAGYDFDGLTAPPPAAAWRACSGSAPPARTTRRRRLTAGRAVGDNDIKSPPPLNVLKHTSDHSCY
jgi:hypothetical protein